MPSRRMDRIPEDVGLFDAPQPYAARCWEIPSSQLDLPGPELEHRAQSMRALMLATHAVRIQQTMGLNEPTPPEEYRKQGARRMIQDLDDVDPATSQPRIYPTATAAALALGVTRAHHVLAACRRRGRAAGHRVCLVSVADGRMVQPAPNP